MTSAGSSHCYTSSYFWPSVLEKQQEVVWLFSVLVAFESCGAWVSWVSKTLQRLLPFKSLDVQVKITFFPPEYVLLLYLSTSLLKQFTTDIIYSGSRQQNVLGTVLKRVSVTNKVFNIKRISLLTSKWIITFFLQLKVNFNFCFLKKKTLCICLLEFLFGTRTVPFLLPDQRSL